VRLFERLAGQKRYSISTVDDYVAYMGHEYPFGLNLSWRRGPQEAAPNTFEGYATRLFMQNPVVWRAVSFRKAVFSQAQFKWRDLGDRTLFGNAALSVLERPWPGGTTADLLARMILHADLGGSAYVRRGEGQLHMLRPDWVRVMMGSKVDNDEPAGMEDTTLVGYVFMRDGRDPVFLHPGEVAHFVPMPDPLAHFRGMSWLTPVVREVQGDKQMTDHKLKFLDNGATPNLVIKFDPASTVEQARQVRDLIESDHVGVANAYKTLYLGGGADATVVGADLSQMDFRNVQGKAETRILMAAGLHPVLAGASEGLQGSSLNAGNYQQVRRNFSDVDLQDLFNQAASSLQVLLKVPAGAELAVDTRHIPFLQDDMRDNAEIQQAQASAMRQLVDGGFNPESVVAAVVANDMSMLEHSGKLSVQLQRPGSNEGVA